MRNIIESQFFKELATLKEKQLSQAKAEDEENKDKNGDSEKDKPNFVEPTCLSWYPDRLAWQLNLTRKDIRREEAYFKLHNFLISENESGKLETSNNTGTSLQSETNC